MNPKFNLRTNYLSAGHRLCSMDHKQATKNLQLVNQKENPNLL